MALSIGELVGYLRLDDTKFEKALTKSRTQFAKAGKYFKDHADTISKRSGQALAAGLTAGAVAAYKMTQKAGDLAETVNKASVIFGDNFDAVNKWSKGAAESMGLSRKAALDTAAGFGDMFSQLGYGSDQAANMSQKVVQMSADLGSFNNLPTADVAERISAAFRGEYDSLQTLIPNINAARVQKVALNQTGKKSADALTAQEKATATLAIVQKDGARATGDFARTSGSLANQQKIMQARTEDLQAKLGNKLIPVLLKIVTVGGKMLTWIEKNQRLMGILLGVVGGLTAAIWLASTAITAWSTITKVASGISKAYAAAQWLVNAALAANPITLVVIALVALVAGLVIAYKKSETFRRIVDAAFKAVKQAVSAVVDWFKRTFVPFFTKTIPGVFNGLVSFVKKHWKAILVGIVAGPVGLAVLAIVKHWDTLKSKTLSAVAWLVKKFFWFAGKIIDGAAKAFGWVPGVGPKLRGAADKFHDFQKRVNASLAKIQDKHVDVSTKVMTKYGSGTVRWLRQNGGLAAGGTVHGPRAPYGDKVLQPLAPGEEVISNRSGQADRYRPILKAINANRYVPGLADGGTVRFGLGTSGLGSAAEKFGTIAADVNRANSSILSTLLRNMSGWFRAHPPMTGGPRATGGWRDLWRMVRSHFSGAILTSAYRPGATVAGFPGVLSRHGMGKAIDIAVNRRIWDWLVPQRNRFFELLGPWGMWRKGQPWHNPITAANHKDHIHISSYDRGGYLQPGWNLAYNGLGRPERVDPRPSASRPGPQHITGLLQIVDFERGLVRLVNGQLDLAASQAIGHV